MITQFWFYFLGTMIVTRLLTPPLHFRNRTLTCKIREKTNVNVHHFHFGFIFVITCLGVLLLKGLTNPVLFLGALGCSLIADELLLSDYSEYFEPKGLRASILAHLIMGSIITIILIML